jgi:two-component system, LytTR family, sensor kinase
MDVNRLIENKNQLFWMLQLAGWTAYGIITWIGAAAHQVPSAYYDVILIATFSGFALTSILRYIFRLLIKQKLLVTVLGFISACYLISLPWILARNIAYYEFYRGGWYPDSYFEYFTGITSAFYIILLWGGLYIGIKYYRMLQQERVATLRANSIAHQAQLKMLRYQLNPHFLFNTLNAISTLILERDTQRANDMVTRLSHFLRYSLDNDPMQKIDLLKEINALKLYLDIEKVRFEERLHLDINIDTQAQDALVPSLLLQPMIENAIKYAIAMSEQGGKISISAKIIEDKLHLEVADNGPGVELINGKIHSEKGVGVNNTQNRLQEIYGEQHRIKLQHNEPSGLKINIEIPYEPAHTLTNLVDKQ